MWLVIHIPKTAGTSLRWALEKQFGKSRVIWDYGPDSKDTSDIVRKHLYTNAHSAGPSNLIDEMSKKSAKVLIGHFPLQKYAHFFEPENIIAFVRNPLNRICSEYLHRLNNATFQGSFSDYVRTAGFQNLQSWFLEGASERTFIGITEQYRSSLGYINTTFQWNLKTIRKNVAWLKGGKKFAENLTEENLQLFSELNKQDMHLYQHATQSFEARTGTDSGKG